MYDCTSNNWSHWNSNEKLRENLEAVPGKHSTDSLQKTAILGTAHIIRKVLQCEAWSVSGGDQRWFKRSTGKKCLWQETSISYNNNNHAQYWQKNNTIKIHDRVCAQQHCNICKETAVQLDRKHRYEHVPKSGETSEGGKVTILWNQQVQTDTTAPHNKQDITIRDNEKGTCVLVDGAMWGDRNVIKKEVEKFLKYKDLKTEIQRMWNVKTKAIPVIIGPTGNISQSFRKYVSNIPGNHEGTTENSYIGHCTHTSESTNIKVQQIQHWN